MNLIEFTKIVSDPSSISKKQTRGLDMVLEEYPFFQAAHFLRLYALKKQRSFRYNDTLKKTAAYTTDRELLFNYITNFDFELPVETKTDLSAPAGDSVRKEDMIKDPTLAQGELPDDLSDQDEQSEAEASLGIGSPLEFKSDESYSFGEWLQLSRLEPIDRSKPAGSKTSKSRSNMDLINDFIGSRPKIGPVENESFDDLSLESSTENEQLMTETLAHVYLEQKKYDKAIAAFTVLSLKYPEKSSFFADRIEAVRKLQNN